MKQLLVIFSLLLTGLRPASAVDFATDRMRILASCLSLKGLDTLSPGTHDSLYWYRQRPLTVRVNSYGEVEHVGLLLFPQGMRNLEAPVVSDFLERELLERNLPNIGDSLRHDLQNKNVYFIIGNAQTALSFNGSEAYSEERIDYRKYRATWSRGEQVLLRITFDMDIQMLSGCNAIQLEDRFFKVLSRYQPHEAEPVQRSFPDDGQHVYVVKGDTFLISQMNNELWFNHDRTGWHLIDSLSSPTKALRNMVTSLEFKGEPQLQLTLDKYGYKTEQLSVPYKHWLQLCLDEGCTPYFGLKSKSAVGYEGTVLMVNRQAGYLHLLSISVPMLTMAENGNGPINGRLYVYIPLHNVDDIFFRR